MNISTFQYIFSSIFKKTSQEKEENGENEVTVSGISNSVDFLQLKILILKIPCPVLFEIHHITGYIENYGGIFFLGPLWRKLGGACGQPVNQTPSRCKGHVTILRTN